MRGSGFTRHIGIPTTVESRVSSMPHAVFSYTSDDMYHMHGAGIGSIFSSIYSSVVPLIKSALRIGTRAATSRVGKKVIKGAKKAAIQAGLNVVGDALEGKNVIRSTKQQLKRATAQMGNTISSLGSSSLTRPRRPKPLTATRHRQRPTTKRPPPRRRPHVGATPKASALAMRRRAATRDLFD